MAYPTADPGSGAFTAGGSGTPQSISGMTEIKDKTISYDATNSEEILNISSVSTVATTKEAIPRRVEIQNVGGVPLIIMAGYQEYSGDTAELGNPEYLHTMIMPGETFSPPVRAVIRTGESSVIMDGTVVNNAAPDANEYTDSGAKTTEGFADDDDTTITFDDASGGSAGSMFKVNDLIRLDDEICRVVSLTDTVFTVERAVYGTAKADHTNNTAIRLPFFNAYHDFDKYSVAQSDSNGKFKCFNFFGQGRSATVSQGIMPGSVAIKFYEAGYRSLGLSGITSSTNTSLIAGGSDWFKIAIDGGTAEAINFTVDSSNTNWGGTNGVISKINGALTDKYNNTASNTFQQKSTVAIVNGDVRFTSGQRLSTSAIALTAGTDGASASYNIFAQQNGWFPALANVPDAIAAKLPDDVDYDRVTYTTIPNTSSFGYDNGSGGLFGMCSGSINYETGEINMVGCPTNAEFVVSALTNSAFSGKLNDAETNRINSLVNVFANTPSQKWNGKVQIRLYG